MLVGRQPILTGPYHTSDTSTVGQQSEFADGSLPSKGGYIYMGRYNRERIYMYTNRNCRLKCSLSLRAFAVLML